MGRSPAFTRRPVARNRRQAHATIAGTTRLKKTYCKNPRDTCATLEEARSEA